MSEKPGTGFVTVKNFQGALEELNTYRKRCDVMKKALQKIKELKMPTNDAKTIDVALIIRECDEALKIL